MSDDTLTEKDLPIIENRMRKLAKKNYEIKKGSNFKKALYLYLKVEIEPYKVDLLKEIPEDEIIAIYHHEEYIDMCRGPHITNTRHATALENYKKSEFILER